MYQLKILYAKSSIRIKSEYYDFFQPKKIERYSKKIYTQQELVSFLLQLVKEEKILIEIALLTINEACKKEILIDEYSDTIFHIDNKTHILVAKKKYTPIQLKRIIKDNIATVTIINTSNGRPLITNIAFEEDLEQSICTLIRKEEISPREQKRLPIYYIGMNLFKRENIELN